MCLRICLVPALLGAAVSLNAGNFESAGAIDVDADNAAGRRPAARRSRRDAISAETLRDAVRAVEAEAARVHGAIKHFGTLRGLDGHALASMWSQAFPYSASQTLSLFRDDGTVFVSTGDIGQMWLRDSSVQLEPYVPLAARSEAGSPLRRVLEAAMSRQIRFINKRSVRVRLLPHEGSRPGRGPQQGLRKTRARRALVARSATASSAPRSAATTPTRRTTSSTPSCSR
ncbi:unnamed protein product [Prorocentrum cordatum]|uniref:Uncharacterized protein n=1 Tax=Prorocentrum cordatum TaxID=2364126 RepID=A0ABN9W7R6_9DINO|nr:unnamed protein product [Polarella glacialis]